MTPAPNAAATVVFETKARTTQQIDFKSWQQAVLAVYEKLTPYERSNAFMYADKAAFNASELGEMYEELSA